MVIPTHLCHSCQEFMIIEKVDGEYIMYCPKCKKKKKKKLSSNFLFLLL